MMDFDNERFRVTLQKQVSISTSPSISSDAWRSGCRSFGHRLDPLQALLQFYHQFCVDSPNDPFLALLALMIPLFGIGKLPGDCGFVHLFLLPILRNTFIGISNVDSNIIDSAKGMGLTDNQIILQVKLPLAAPVIMSGIRLAVRYVITWATLASYIGAGGLGDYIFNGLNVYDQEMTIWGTLPVTVLALLADFLLGKLERFVSPQTTSAKGGN